MMNNTKEIIIEIRGGVAEVVKKSSGIKLSIRDYDNKNTTILKYTEETYESEYIIDNEHE